MKRLGLTAAAILLSSATLNAATFTVDTTADEAGAGFQVCSAAANDCSLRGAVIKANADAVADEIVLPASATPYVLTIPQGAEADNAGGTDPATGDLDIANPVKITGAGADQTTIDASGIPDDDRIFHFNNGTSELSGLTLTGGNSGFRGGAVWAFGVSLTINGCHIHTNQATADGGGLSIDNGGGEIVAINNTTVSGNTAVQRGGGFFFETATATVTNSTFSGNTATGDGTANTGGGAIDVTTGSMTLINTTLVGNNVTTAGSVGAGLRNAAGGAGVLTIKNTLLADNNVAGVSQNCALAPGGNVAVSQGGSISGDASCTASFLSGAGDLNGVAGTIVSATLADNGGPTPTHLLSDGSPAIDFIPASNCTDASATALTEDQRGSGRPEDGDDDGTADCDAGAVEIEASPDGTTGGSTGSSTGSTAGTGGDTGGDTSGDDSSGGCSLIRT